MELIITTKQGFSLRFAEAKIRPQGRQGTGVRGINLRDENDAVVDVVRVHENAYLLTITDKGFGRKTPLEAFPTKINRGGKGVTSYRTDDEHGYVIGAKVIRDERDILLINSDGVIIRIRAESLRPMGRTARGYRLMKLAGDSRVVTFAPADREEDAEIAELEEVTEIPGESEILEEAEGPGEAEILEESEILEETEDTILTETETE
jgi:DNA gyrase subunit A